MTSSIKRIGAAALKAALHDGAEIAVRDAREELVCGERHILMASCLPLGRVEVAAARIAATELAAVASMPVLALEGGTRAWTTTSGSK